VIATLRYGLARFRTGRGRTVLRACGIAAAGAMVGAAVTVAWGLSTGFDRAAARAQLPDAIATFDERPLGDVSDRVSALPNLRAAAYRLTVSGRHVEANGNDSGHATLIGVQPGPPGYALLRGRDLRADGQAVVEAGLARAWGVRPGEPITIDGRLFEVVGVGLSPDTVAFPLAKGPRLWLRYEDVEALAGAPPGAVNQALLWVRDARQLDVTLAQARMASYGVSDLQFVTRAGVRALVADAGGIVIALLIGFSVAALAAAGAMLAAAAASDVQRRLSSIGLLRALGASRRGVALGFGAEAALLALPAASLGVFLGWLVASGPATRLLESVNELPPGGSLALLLVAADWAIVALVAAASAIPAWRAARRSPLETLAAADVRGLPTRAPLPSGPAGLGFRLALARPFRTAGTVAVLGASSALILLILTIATVLASLRTNPAAVGRRYQLSVDGPAAAAGEVARIPGISAATPRWSVEAADSFDLGEPFTLVAFGRNHTRWEAPPLAEGRRIRNDYEAEVGLGLAQALNLHPGATLAAQVPGGRELRFRVVGVDRVLQEEGRLAYVQPRRLLATGWAQSTLAVNLARGADAARVESDLATRGFFGSSSGGISSDSVRGWATRNGGFVSILVSLLRTVALLDGLVCLYALAQMLALTAQERRRAVALVRACGGSVRQLAAVFAGAAVPVAALAAPVGILLERNVVGPTVSRFAATYVSLPLAAGLAPIVIVSCGLLAAASAAAWWVGRSAAGEPVIIGLREE
jgi:ABC-type antimicrobial peptide transport system permease subunit